MANYTISTLILSETIGDSPFFGTMASSGTMTATPDDGYVVSATNFSHGTLPSAISSVTFANSTTAGQPGNTVVITVNLDTNFTAETDVTINIPITGSAQLFRLEEVPVTFDIDFEDRREHGVSNSGSALTNITDVSTSSNGAGVADSDGVIRTTLTSVNSIVANESIKIGTLSILKVGDNRILTLPTLSYQNISSDIVTLELNNITEDSGERTLYVFNVMFKSSVNVSSDLTGAKIIINYKSVASQTITNQEIKRIEYGSNEISQNGADRNIKIIGDVGAEFDLIITKESDKTSILDTFLAKTDVLFPGVGLIKAISVTLESKEKFSNKPSGILLGEFEFRQTFPSVTSSEKYNIEVIPKNTTILNSNLAQIGPQVILDQFKDPVLTLTTSLGGIATNNPSNIVKNGKPNSKPERLTHIKTINEIFQISYSLTHTSGAGNTVSRAGATPKWSSAKSADSHWTNSVKEDNGGTHIEIINMVATAGDPTATFTADVVVKKFGNEDVTMNLDLSQIFST